MAQRKFLNNAIFSLLYSGPSILKRDTNGAIEFVNYCDICFNKYWTLHTELGHNMTQYNFRISYFTNETFKVSFGLIFIYTLNLTC